MFSGKSFFGSSLAITLLISLAGFVPTLEAQEVRNWTLRGHLSSISPDGGSVSTASSTFSVDGGEGYAVGLEFRLTSHVGIEVEALKGTTDGELRFMGFPGVATDEIGVDFLTLKGNYHLRPTSRVDPYLGVGAGFFYNEDATFTVSGQSETLRFDDDNIWLLEAGVLIALGERWLLSVRAQQVFTLFEGEVAGQDLDFDPVLVGVGFGVRF